MDYSAFIRFLVLRILLITTCAGALLILLLVLIGVTVFKKAKKNHSSNHNGSIPEMIPEPDSQLDFEIVFLQNQGKREYQQDSFYVSNELNQSFCEVI